MGSLHSTQQKSIPHPPTPGAENTNTTVSSPPTTSTNTNKNNRFTALVIGGGVVGVSVAYELGRRGFNVTVVEKESHCGIWDTYLSSYIPREITSFVPFRFDTWQMQETPLYWVIDYFNFYPWVYNLLWNPKDPETLQAANRLLKYSRKVTMEYEKDNKFEHIPRGPAFNLDGTPQEGSYFVDAALWTDRLRRLCEKEYGVTFLMNAEVQRIATRTSYGEEYVKYVMVDSKSEGHLQIAADRVIVAAGSSSPYLMRPYYYFPTVSVYGYTIEATNVKWPWLQVTKKDDDDSKPNGGDDSFGVGSGVCLTDSLWCRKTGPNRWSLSGLHSMHYTWERIYDKHYITNYFNRALKATGIISSKSPNLIDAENVSLTHRAGRPWTPDGLPVVGRVSRNLNLYVCFGHGEYSAAWGPGTARILADIMAGVRPELDPMMFTPARYLPDILVHPSYTANVGGEGYIMQAEAALGRFGRWMWIE
eukprot:PhF_6_TR638/c0_g1_i1/m.884/K00285/dadA; D-amino-acid dehydrogenase